MTAKIEQLGRQAKAAGKPLQGRRGRDSQRQKVYDAESVLRSHSKRISHDQIVALVRKIESSEYVKRNYGVLHRKVITSGHGHSRTSVAKGDHTIVLAAFGHNDWITIHEVAHGYTVADPGHGWLFCYVYLDLVRKFMGKEAHDALKASFKKRKVAHTVPRKKREMTPEQKQVLVDRMAKARAAKAGNIVEPHVFLKFRANPFGDRKGQWEMVAQADKWGVKKYTRRLDSAITRSSSDGIARMFAQVQTDCWEKYDEKALAVPVRLVKLGDYGWLDKEWDPESALITS